MQIALIDGGKYCGGCKTIQPLSNWTAKGTRCKTCVGESARKSYLKYQNNPELLSSKRKKDQERRKAVKEECVEYKGGVCQDCGNTYPACVYDFHHEDPKQKDFSIAKKSYLSFDKVKDELDKCVLLCANCHRIRHHG